MIRNKFLLLLPLVAAVFLSACMSVPKSLDLSPRRATENARYVAEMKSLSPIVMNKIHAWEVRLALPSGQPVTGANITIDGGMPQHLHGLPTKPRVTKELGDGRYLVEGMKFSMDGWWEIKLHIVGEHGTDKVTFNLVLPVQS